MRNGNRSFSAAAITLTQKLVESMERSGRALRELHHAMETNRTAWLALRPEHLESAVAQMDQLAAKVREEERLRDGITTDLSNAVGLTGTVNVTRLSELLPTASAQLLQRAAKRLSATARAIGAEGRFGERLLQNSQEIHEGLLRSAVTEEQKSAPGYDRAAQHATAATRVGALVNGVM